MNITMNPHAEFSKQDWDKSFLIFEKIRKKAKKITPKKVERLINKAIAEVRKTKKPTDT